VVLVQTCNATIDVSAILQGYHTGAGLMTNALANQSVGSSTTDVDSVTIELHEATSPYDLAYSVKGILQNNGTVSCMFNNIIHGRDYYLVIKNRNHIETWSANPVTLAASLNYNFTTSNTKAFGNNLVEVNPNSWAIYSGDINQDGTVDNLDISPLELDAENFATGYYTTDLNGDGSVDNLDVSFIEINAEGFVDVIKP
jgi:hypothetical protein